MVEIQEGGFSGKNHYVPKFLYMKCMKFVYLKKKFLGKK